MTIEQKAKAYDKAIEKIKYVMEHGVSPTLNKEDLQDIFPELKESEDEKTCKWIIGYLNDEFLCADELLKPKLQSAIAWLEKQGEKKEINPTLQEKGRMDDAFTKMMLKPQVDGFDAELNALLKKYEHLPDDELVECLKFYTAVIINNKKRIEEQQ